MKRTLFTVTLILLGLLAGCACKHEWTEPDCVTPAVCTKCQETGENALGHDWAEAACEAPETCLRCGATQGTAVGHDWEQATCTVPETCRSCGKAQGAPAAHDFQDWSFDLDAETMLHTCGNCGHKEQSELDRAVYLDSLLRGYWNVCMVYQDEKLSLIEDLVYLDLYLYFDEDGSVSFTTPEKGTVDATWLFSSYEQKENSSIYCFTLSCADTQYSMRLHTHSDADSVLPQELLVISSRKQEIYLAQYEKAAALLDSHWKVAMNKYGSPSGNMANWLRFRADRTVTGYLNEPVEGRWVPVPIVMMGGTIADPSLYGVVILPNTEGAEPFQCTLNPGDPCTLKMKVDNRSHTFEPGNAHDVEKANASRQIPLGTWTSTAVYHMGELEKATTDYSVTFLEDGTFTADFGKEYTGTWIVDDMDPFFGYWLYFDGIREEVYCEIDARNVEPENATLSISHPPQFADRRVDFAKLNEEEASLVLQGPSLPVGSWISTNVLRIRNDTQQRENTSTRDYSITFREDGTFTATLDTEVSGAWEYKTMHPGESASFEYWLYIRDSRTQMFIHDDGGMNFSFGNSEVEYRITYYFKPLKEGMAEAIAQGPSWSEHGLPRPLTVW